VCAHVWVKHIVLTNVERTFITSSVIIFSDKSRLNENKWKKCLSHCEFFLIKSHEILSILYLQELEERFGPGTYWVYYHH